MGARRNYPRRRPRKLGRFPQPLPDLNVMVEFTRPDGSTYTKLMAGKAYRALMARSKGGRKARDNGKQHRFNSETARKAAKKLWATRWRKVRGVRIGVPALRRQGVARHPLRVKHWGSECAQQVGDDAIWYEGPNWMMQVRIGPYRGPVRRISEVTALRKLGHLPSAMAPVPTRVITRIKLVNGKLVAIPETDSAVPTPKGDAE